MAPGERTASMPSGRRDGCISHELVSTLHSPAFWGLSIPGVASDVPNEAAATCNFMI